MHDFSCFCSRINAACLEHKTHTRAQVFAIGNGVLSKYSNISTVGFSVTFQDFDSCCFACPVCSEEGKDCSTVYMEAQIVNGSVITISLGDSVDCDCGTHGFSCLSACETRLVLAKASFLCNVCRRTRAVMVILLRSFRALVLRPQWVLRPRKGVLRLRIQPARTVRPLGFLQQ